jgi:hypothetical protein
VTARAGVQVQDLRPAPARPTAPATQAPAVEEPDFQVSLSALAASAARNAARPPVQPQGKHTLGISARTTLQRSQWGMSYG